MAEANTTVDEELKELPEGEEGDDTIGGGEGDDTLEGGAGGESDAAIPTFEGDAPSPDSDEIPEGQESSVIKTLREQNRENTKRLAEEARLRREAEAERDALKGATQKPLELGAKPARKNFDYDDKGEYQEPDKAEAAYEAALDSWYQRKAQVETAQQAADRERQQAEDAFKAKQEQYNLAKKALPVDDYEAVEAVVMAALPKDRQAMLIDLTDKPQHLIYALGKSPARLEELAKLSLPHFLKRLGSLETQMKMQPKRIPPEPAARPQGGGGAVRTPVSKRLETLKAHAEKTGDYTAYHAARREIKAA